MLVLVTAFLYLSDVATLLYFRCITVHAIHFTDIKWWWWWCTSWRSRGEISQYQHQSTPVPSTGNVCPALWCRNMDLLGRRHEYTGGFPHEVSVTETSCTLVGSCLQCRGASVIWFVNHWWQLTSSTLISLWPCCLLHAWTLECQDMMLWPAGEHHRAALTTSDLTSSGECQRPTTI